MNVWLGAPARALHGPCTGPLKHKEQPFTHYCQSLFLRLISSVSRFPVMHRPQENHQVCVKKWLQHCNFINCFKSSTYFAAVKEIQGVASGVSDPRLQTRLKMCNELQPQAGLQRWAWTLRAPTGRPPICLGSTAGCPLLALAGAKHGKDFRRNLPGYPEWVLQKWNSTVANLKTKTLSSSRSSVGWLTSSGH